MLRKIGIFTVQIAWRALRKIIVIIAMEEPGGVEKVSDNAWWRLYGRLLRNNSLFHIVDR